MKEFFNRTLVLNILLGLGYLILAVLGRSWGDLTLNATLVWPPSGLAAFGFIAFGRRVLPGLLFSAIVSIQTLPISSIPNLAQLITAGIIGSASILQALLIARFSRNPYKNDFRLSTLSTFYFTLIIMACCTLASTVGNITLWQAGIISHSSALENWTLWWMGDSIGVLIITPLLLWIYRQQTLYKNSQANAFLIFCAGMGIVLLAVSAVGHNDHETYQKNLLRETENLQTNIQTNINLATRDLSTLQEYLTKISPNQIDFQQLTEPLLKRNSWLYSFSWVPTSNSEKKVELNYDLGFSVSRLNDNKFLWKQSEINPLNKNFLYSPTIKNVSTHSEIFVSKSNEATETSLINLMSPTYSCTRNKSTNCHLINIVSSTINLNTLMQSVIANNNLKNTDITLAITTTNGKRQYLQWNNNSWKSITKEEPDATIKHTQASNKKTITIANENWQLFIAHNNVNQWLRPSVMQCSIVIGGLTIIFLLSAYLQALYRQDQLIIGNQTRLQREIHEQTQALQAANNWLLKEIDEKRLTEKKLSESETRIRALLDNIPDPIWLKSITGTYLEFNRAVSKLFQQPEQELLKKGPDHYADTPFANDVFNFEKLALTTEHAIRRNLWVYIPEKNEKRLMDITKVAIRDNNKIPIGLLSIARDMTEQHQLIDELEKFKRFAEYASEGFSIMSLSAEIMYMNRSMQKMLSFQDKTTPLNFLDYLKSEHHEAWREDIFPSILLNSYWQGELTAARIDGSYFPTKETFFIIRDDKGKPIYLGEVMSDISEQKHVESSLYIAKEAAEAATRAKSIFLANMSHEIRTPLNAVLGYSQLLIMDKNLSTQQHERMNAILKAGQRLLHLINDVLDLSKIEAGALHVRNNYFDLHQELKDIAAIMNTKAIAKELTLQCDIQLPIPAIVNSDRQKIGQILLNLLGNAIKFTQHGGIMFKVFIDNHQIKFIVSDSGSGITPQELQLLFAAFKQGKAGEESGGTGLGLVISKHIAEHLGGEITLDSTLNQGTRAVLRLPLIIEHQIIIEDTQPVTHIYLASTAQCKVLIIEDDFASRDLLVNLLRDIGCELFEAGNGNEGIAKAIAHTPDIIFTDIRMPELSGTDMLKELRKKFSPTELPVIAVSASSLEHERDFYLNEGFHDFIGKPYQFSDIYKALEKFTHAEFIATKSQENNDDTVADRETWNDPDLLIVLTDHLKQLKIALNHGDMNTSKHLFAKFTARELGKIYFQKIDNAIRQYDFVLAENILDSLLLEIHEILIGTLGRKGN